MKRKKGLARKTALEGGEPLKRVPLRRKPPVQARAAVARPKPKKKAPVLPARPDLGKAWPPPPVRRGEVRHHVIKESTQKRAGGNLRDGRNLLAINWERHLGHHWSPGAKLDLSVLQDHHFEYAAALLGPERAYSHLRRYYVGEDLRLNALIGE